MTDVEDLIRQRIEAARRKAEAEQRRRQELAAARAKGVARRHARKLRQLAARGLALAPTFDPDNATLSASGA